MATPTAAGPPGWPEWIETQLARRGIRDPRVLAAFAAVPRGDFVPGDLRRQAQSDSALPIGCGQTISQPYVVAVTLQALELRGTERALDVGTGSGYQAALLTHLAGEVWSIETHGELALQAAPSVRLHARSPVHLRHGDGSLGWPRTDADSGAPYDAIAVGARAPRVPQALLQQLAPGGRLVIPLGGSTSQTLYLYVRSLSGALQRRSLEHVAFVPLVGEQGV